MPRGCAATPERLDCTKNGSRMQAPEMPSSGFYRAVGTGRGLYNGCVGEGGRAAWLQAGCLAANGAKSKPPYAPALPCLPAYT